jgi:hypothetical protein
LVTCFVTLPPIKNLILKPPRILSFQKEQINPNFDGKQDSSGIYGGHMLNPPLAKGDLGGFANSRIHLPLQAGNTDN